MGSNRLIAACVFLVAVALVLAGVYLVAGFGGVLILLGVLLGAGALLVDLGGGDGS